MASAEVAVAGNPQLEMETTPESLLPYIIDVVVGLYDGERSKDELPDGSGRCTFKNGSTYEGSWKDGYMHGQGIYVWVDGVRFEGTFERNLIEGNGTFTWPNGDQYVGGVKRGKRNGGGKMILKNEGTCYDGEWVDGLKHGEGELDYGNGKVYTGQWSEDLKHGKGVMRYDNGDVYEGGWVRGMKEGSGRMDYKANNSFYVGDWAADQPNGKGEHVWKEIGASNPYLQTFNRYVGDFKDGMRHGRGTFFYATGASYRGDWRNNLKQGDGTFVYEDGTVYTGSFEQDRLPRRQGGGSAPGCSVKVDISDLIGGDAESKANEDLCNCILRFNSELRALYRKYTKLETRAPKTGDQCDSSLLVEQTIELCKHHQLVDLDYSLCRVRDVVAAVCGKLMQVVDSRYHQPGRASVLYKDLVEILVRISFHKYHALESPAQRFVRLVEGDILPKTSGEPRWHYLCDDGEASRGFLAGVGANDAALRAIFDGIAGSESTEVGARDLLRLLLSKGVLAAPEPAAEIKEEEEDGEKDEKEEEEGEKGEEEGGSDGAEAGDAEKQEDAEDEKPKAEEGEDVAEAEGGEEAAAEAKEEEEEEAEEGGKPRLTLGLALKCIHVANVGSGETREEIFEAGTGKVIGIFDAAVTMKYPEFVDSVALCADQAFEGEDFAEKLGQMVEALGA